MKIRHNLITFRLVLLFLLLILPIFTMGVFFYSRGMALQDTLVASTMGQRLNFKMQTLSDQVRAAQTSLISLAEEDDLNALATRAENYSRYERADMLNRLQRRLYTLQFSYDGVQQITLLLPKTGFRILSSGGQQLSTIEAIDPEALAAEMAQAARTGGRTVIEGGRMFYLYQQPLPGVLQPGSIPRILFRIEFKLTDILQRFTEDFSDSPLRYVLLDAAHDVLLTNETDQSFVTAFQQLAQDDGFWRAEDPSAYDFQDFNRSVSRLMTVAGNRCYVLPVSSRVPQMNIVFYILRDQAASSFDDYRAWVWGLTGALALAILLYSWYAHSRVQAPVSLLLSGFERLERGDMDFEITYRPRNEFRTLTERFNQTLKRLSGLLSQLYDQRILTQQAEMKHLQAQINPHFLYNNFYILDSMIAMEDYDNASEFCRQLGAYFQYVTRSDRTEALLSEELRHVKTYIGIQTMRFRDSLHVEFDAGPDDLDDPAVPRIILQPIVENAFKHALEHCDGEKLLRVRVWQTADAIHITVENNGCELNEEELARLRASLDLPGTERTSTGLANVHRRLLLSHGAGLTLRAGEEGGLLVEITLHREGAR